MAQKVWRKIKLLCDLPVEAKHGMVQGLILNGLPNPHHRRGQAKWFAVSPVTGATIYIFAHEAEESESDTKVGDSNTLIRDAALATECFSEDELEEFAGRQAQREVRDA